MRLTQQEIADKLGMAQKTVDDLLARLEDLPIPLKPDDFPQDGYADDKERQDAIEKLGMVKMAVNRVCNELEELQICYKPDNFPQDGYADDKEQQEIADKLGMAQRQVDRVLSNLEDLPIPPKPDDFPKDGYAWQGRSQVSLWRQVRQVSHYTFVLLYELMNSKRVRFTRWRS